MKEREKDQKREGGRQKDRETEQEFMFGEGERQSEREVQKERVMKKREIKTNREHLHKGSGGEVNIRLGFSALIPLLVVLWRRGVSVSLWRREIKRLWCLALTLP